MPGTQAKRIHRSSFLFLETTSRRISQSMDLYTDDQVTKDKSGWGLTIKHCATIIHEDSAVLEHTVISLQVYVEDVSSRLFAELPPEVVTDSINLRKRKRNVEWEVQTGTWCSVKRCFPSHPKMKCL